MLERWRPPSSRDRDPIHPDHSPHQSHSLSHLVSCKSTYVFVRGQWLPEPMAATGYNFLRQLAETRGMSVILLVTESCQGV